MTAVRPLPTLHLVVGARPNFMKIAPLVRALRAHGGLRWKLVHTGQHHDHDMSGVFFDELEIPAPDVHFNCGGGTQAAQTGAIMQAFEAHCSADRPDAVVVVGDVNSCLAAALVAKKAGLPLAHVEAGLRSGDRTMPEEINRIVTDAISDWFFVTEPAGAQNLRREGQPESRIFEVGHVMADNVLHQSARLDRLAAADRPAAPLKPARGTQYGVVTLHRPSNVDDPVVLGRLMAALNRVSVQMPLFFALHPRTRQRLQALGVTLSPRIHLLPPQPYLAFLDLWRDAAVVLTDSGGLQEETTVMGVACLTLRDNTERPITLTAGTNRLAGSDPDRIESLAIDALRHGRWSVPRPPLWDGQAGQRIVKVLAEQLA